MQSGLTPLSVLQQAKAAVLESDAKNTKAGKAAVADIDLFITIFEVEEFGVSTNLLPLDNPKVVANRLRENLNSILLPLQEWCELHLLQESLPAHGWEPRELPRLLQTVPQSQMTKLLQFSQRVELSEQLPKLVKLLRSSKFEQLCQLQQVHQFTYPSTQYNALHNALLLLGQYFPFGLDDKTNIISCGITTEEIEENKIRFCLGSGHQISISGTIQSVSGLFNINPFDRKPIPERDWDRMQLVKMQEAPILETHSIEYAAGGILGAMFFVVIPIMGAGSLAFITIILLTVVGIIHFPVFLTAFLSSHLFSYIMLAMEFFPIVIGACIGAIIGRTPIPSNIIDVNALKEKVGDVLENASLKKLKYQPEQAEKKNSVTDILEEKKNSFLQDSAKNERIKERSQDDLVLLCPGSGTSKLRISRSCPNFFPIRQLHSEASFVDSSTRLGFRSTNKTG